MCCTVVLYYYMIFSFLNKESSLKGFSEEKLKRSCTTYYSHLCYYYTPQLIFSITQTQDGLWNIVHSTFMFFHIPYDDVKEGTTYIHRPGQI